jgi:metal-dependent amidase/aminoacylase/carboxypeptidase family protein
MFGKEKVNNNDLPDMGSEDFSEYLKVKPGCYFYLGNGRPGVEPV